MFKNFIEKYKVFLTGLVFAIVSVLQQYLTLPTWEVAPLLTAVGIAVLAYVGNEWRGKGVTVLGLIGMLAYNAVSIWQGGTFDVKTFILMTLVSIGLAFAPAPKPQSYEENKTIVDAKKQLPNVK